MISAERFREIALWAGDLAEADFEAARKGIVERSYEAGAYICHKGDRLDHWTGVIEGLIKLATSSESGKSVTLAGLREGAWFGEGTILKNEARQYDLVTLRPTRLALMSRPTFMRLYENSAAFNRLLVRQLNERLGQFIALVEYDRMLGSAARVARSLAWLFNPVIYPHSGNSLVITQEELGLVCGLSRQATNQGLKRLADAGLIEAQHNAIVIYDIDGLRRFGD